MAIEPDTKDWTWVLERPCPDCGFESSAFSRDEVGPMIRDNALAWTGVLGGDDLSVRPESDRWSPLEYAGHVRDVFRTFHTRLGLMLTEDDPLFANWDQDATVVEDDYLGQNPVVVAAEIVMAANRLADAFDAVSGGQWERPGRRSDGAEFTVESLARYLIHDPIHHLWDVARPTD